MSGGVDSSVAAALLLRAGYDVVGAFMRLGSPGETLEELKPDAPACTIPPVGGRTIALPQPPKIGHQGCCSITDAADARLVAAELGIPFYVCNFKKDFGRIIDYFVAEYADGRTPNPCVRCNDWLKFGKLHEYSRQIGAEFVASGHYARIDRDEAGRPRLLRGVDPNKDQSYVLFGVPAAQLSRMLLPIGAYPKSEVRALAQRLGLPVFDKPDSQEICFVPDNDYAALVSSRRPDLTLTGTFVDVQGRVLGTHEGQHHFTIGQRRGLGLSLREPGYVIAKDPATNTVTIGGRNDLLVTGVTVAEANWLTDPAWVHAAAGAPQRVLVKYRYNSPAVPALVQIIAAEADGIRTPSGRTERFTVEFETPQAAVATGQALVVYDHREPDWVMGGGWIASTARLPS